MTRAAQSKEFPGTPEKAIGELYEKQSVNISDLPDEIKQDYLKNLQEELTKKYSPR